MWTVDSDGLIISSSGEHVAIFYRSGDIRSEAGKLRGVVDFRGDARDLKGNHLGRAGADSQIYDKEHLVIGYVAESGGVYNTAGHQVGRVHINIHVKTRIKNMRPMHLRAAAAAWLICHQE